MLQQIVAVQMTMGDITCSGVEGGIRSRESLCRDTAVTDERHGHDITVRHHRWWSLSPAESATVNQSINQSINKTLIKTLTERKVYKVTVI